MAERRRFKRVAARLKVWCEGDDFTLLSQSANVSKGGMFVQASSVPPHSVRMTVTIEDLGVVAEAETCWARTGRDTGATGIGLHIIAFQCGADAYADYVERMSARAGEHRFNWAVGPGKEEP